MPVYQDYEIRINLNELIEKRIPCCDLLHPDHCLTEKQVADYFKENGKPVSRASEFYLYYDSQGWIKKNGLEVKNWKSTARTWWKMDEKSKPNYKFA